MADEVTNRLTLNQLTNSLARSSSLAASQPGDSLRFAPPRGTTPRVGVPDSGTSPPGDMLDRLTRANYSLRPLTVGEDMEQKGGGNPFLHAAGVGFRTIAGLLEPLQLPKDVLDAFLAGGLDPDTTIKQRMDRIQWVNYIPLGNQPQRAATGEEIAGFLGVKNGTAAKIVGAGLDVFADPLVFGGWVSTAGRVAKAAGAISMGEDLLKAGKLMDEVVSIGGINRRISALSPWKRNVLDKRMESVVRSVFNWRLPFQVSKGAAARTLGDAVLSSPVALEMQMPGFGGTLPRLRSLARQAGRDVAEQAEALVAEGLHDVLHYSRPTVLQRIGKTFGLYGRAERITDGMPVELAEMIQKSAYDFGDRIGWGTRGYARAGIADDSPILTLSNLSQKTKYQSYMASSIRKKVALAAIELNWNPNDAVRKFDEFSTRISEADALLGYHLSGAEYVKGAFLQSVNAIEGPAGARHAQDLWREALRQGGVVAPGEDAYQAAERFMNQPASDLYVKADLDVPANLTPDMTIGEMFRGSQGPHALNIAFFAQGLQNGHMRRAYGIFQDEGTFEAWQAALRKGRVIPANLIDNVPLSSLYHGRPKVEQAIRGYLDRMGFDYHDNKVIDAQGNIAQAGTTDGISLSRAGALGGQSPTRGLMVTQAGLLDALSEQVGRKDAQQAVLDLVEYLQGQRGGSNVLSTLAARVKDLGERYANDVMKMQGMGAAFSRIYGQPVRSFGRTAVSTQRIDDITQKGLEALGELASAPASVLEQAQLARSRIPWSRFMSDVEREGRAAGYIGGNDPSFITVLDDPTIWGRLAGEKVHPFLHKELMLAMRQRTEQQATAFNRVKALITGGYLASPSVITANLAGGLYTYGLLGGNVLGMVRSMASTFQEFLKANRDPGYSFDDLDALRNYTGIRGSALVDDSMGKALKKFRSEAAGMADSTPTRFLRVIGDVLQGQLDAPASGILSGRGRRGLPWAGLDGFQFLEDWMKVSIFKTERDQLARAAGINPADFASLRSVRSGIPNPFRDVNPDTGRALSASVIARRNKMLDIEAQAAETARIGVFSYDELPDSLRLLRNSGLILFPGFPFFLSGRTINAAINHPGVLAVSDRLSDAIANAQLDDDEKRLLYAGMSEWLRIDEGVPMPGFSYTDANGDERKVVIPLGGLIPTNTFANNPWGESLLSAGIYKPFVEAATAWLKGDGDAIFSARYGQRVFGQGLPAYQQASQTLGYLFNSLAPGGVRKLVNYTPEDGYGGVVPAALKQAGLINDQLGSTIYSINEAQTQRADRRVWDEMLAATLRSPQVEVLSGPLASWRKELENSQRSLSEEVAVYNNRLERAQLAGNTALARRLTRTILDKQRAWMERTRPLIQAVSMYDKDKEQGQPSGGLPGLPTAPQGAPSEGDQPDQTQVPQGSGFRNILGSQGR